MKHLSAVAGLFLAATPESAPDEVPFRPSAEIFPSAAACSARLGKLAADARWEVHAAVAGPYEVAPRDLRVHWVDVSGAGHRITEHRCLEAKLSGRSWRHSVVDDGGEAPETIDEMAARAEWLKKVPAQQK